MSTKKRKTSQEADPADDEDGGTPLTMASSTTMRRTRTPAKQFRANPKPMNNAFVQLKKTLYQDGVQQIMQHYEKALLKDKLPAEPEGEHPSFCRDALYQCRGQLAKLREMYDPPPGDVIVMGQDDMGQLGLVHFMGPGDENKQVAYGATLNRDMLQTFIQAACGGLHSCCLSQDGRPFTFGLNDDGALGRVYPEKRPNQNDSEYDDMKEKLTATPIEVTGFHPSKYSSTTQKSAAAQTSEDGQIIAVAAGDNHTTFLTINGNVYVTGMYKDNDSGKWCEKRPSDDPCTTDNIEHSNVNGNRLTPVHVYRLKGRVKQIAAGGAVNGAVTEDGTLYTWGMGHTGELARSADMMPPNEGTSWNLMRDKVYINENSTFDCDKVDKLFLTPQPVRWEMGPGTKMIVEHVAFGMCHCCVVARNFGSGVPEVYTSGHNKYGQLGHGDTDQRHELTLVQAFKGIHMTKVGGGNFHSLFLTAKGVIYSCGRVDYGQLGFDVGEKNKPGDFFDTPRRVPLPISGDLAKVGRVVDIASGENHSLALTSTGQIYAWGYGEYGQAFNDPLGSPEDVPRPVLAKEWLAGTNPVATSISGGGQHTLVVAKRYKA